MSENGKYRKKDSARLVWDSKPRRAANPKDIEFQTAEVVIPNPQFADELPLSYLEGRLDQQEIDKQQINRLIWGDNLLAMQALLTQGYEGKVNLIYIDPPFDSKADYSQTLSVEGNEVTKAPSVIERLAYKDTWAGGTDSYLDMLYSRLQIMKRLLSKDGSIFVHCDWHANSYIRVLLDEVFGKTNFKNEIIWCYTGPGSPKMSQYNRKHDNIYWYAKNIDECCFYDSQIRIPHDEKTAANFKAGLDGSGFLTEDYELPNGKVPEDWWELAVAARFPRDGIKRTGYATEKPWALIDRIIRTVTKENDLVADFFAGSGTTMAIASSINRRWIGCELGKIGIQVARTRLVDMGVKPFLIENIGNYQREMIYLTGGRIWEMQHLILKVYGATPRDKTSGLGIRKTNDTLELVYVGYPDRPITARKAEELAIQAQKLDGEGYKNLILLGWDYEYNYHQALENRLKSQKNKINVKIESRDIPPDIYDYLKKAKTDDEIEALSNKIQFFARPYLRLEKADVKSIDNNTENISVGIKRYVLMDIPLSRSTKKEQEQYEELLQIAKDDFAVIIDYWAVDWDYDGATFKSQWQAFRGNGKRATTVPIIACDTLQKKSKRVIAIRVVDIFGNDAAAIIEI